MKKNISIIGLLLFLSMINPASAFTNDSALNIQLNTYNNLHLSFDQLILESTGSLLNGVYTSPSYENDTEMYVSSINDLFINRDFSADFNIVGNLPESLESSSFKLVFEGNYYNNGTILIYSTDKIFVTYNRGSTWSDITGETGNNLLKIDFGPRFSTTTQLFILKEDGLYKRDVSGGPLSLILGNNDNENVNDFAYMRTQDSDLIYYAAKGKKLLKTENGGTTWLEKTYDYDVMQVQVIPNGGTYGSGLVLTDDNKVSGVDPLFNVFSISVPAEINVINDIKYANETDAKVYVMHTDQGFYRTYDKGNNWSKVNYDLPENYHVSDFALAKNGSQIVLWAIIDNVLYRDVDFSGTFTEYMTGIETQLEFALEGSAESYNLLDLNEDKFAENYVVESATLFADGDLNDQTMTFYMTADGENWEEVILEEAHEFEYPGNILKWKVEMATTDTTVSPVLRSVIVDYGLEELPVEEVSPYCAGFPDIPANDAHCDAITYVQEQGIFEGYPDGTFGPETTINRAETVKVIVEGFDVPLLEDDGTTLGFSDTIINEWYMTYLNTAKEAGIIEGYPNGTFKPEQTVNYVEMLKIFLETAEAELSQPAADADWYQKYVDFAKANALVEYTKLDAGMRRVDVAELFYQWSLL